MSKSWKTWMSYLVSPVAIGLYITLITMKLTIDYYELATRTGEGREHGQGITSVLFMAHQKSVDYRLRVRGPRAVSPKLAMLTVDERSVAAIGRWPWPRSVLAKAMDNAYANGAKVLAFDMVFSEPSLNPATMVRDQVRAAGHLTPDFENRLEAVRTELDSDKILGAAYKTYADKVVAGSFFAETIGQEWPPRPEIEFCNDLVFKRTPEAKQWDKEEVLIAVNDPFQPYMPSAVSELVAGMIDMREKEVREKLGTGSNANERLRIEAEVRSDMRNYCHTVLDELAEPLGPLWQQEVLAKENPEQFNFPTYQAWLEDYRNKSLPNSVVHADGWVLNTPEIAAGTKHTAYFNTEQDADGTIRSKALIVRTANSYFPGLGLKAFLVANGYNASPKLDFNPASGFKEVTDIEITDNETGDPVMHIPTDRQGKLLINYAGPEKMFPYLSFADLLSDSPDAMIEQRIWNAKEKTWKLEERKVKKAEFMKDKIFVVGATAIGIYDLRVTPFQENFPGAETHLNAIDNMLQKNFFKPAPDEQIYMMLVLGILGLVLSISLSYLGAVPGLALAAACVFGTAWVDQHYFFNRGTVITVIWPLFLALMLYVSLTFYRYLTEERGKKELRQTFQKYVSPAIVEEILSDPKNIQLGGRKVKLTVFFSDVRGFTTISEKLDPRALSDLLNSYLTPMTDLVFKNRGTLDKYMGDAIMAFFGAPISFDDHAKYACRCALQSLVKLRELQREYEAKGLPSIDIGIGLNTGEVSVGNMGSETVRSYTVMGDAVNLASRLEGINKTYGTRIILSEMTYVEVKDNFVCREVDWVRVKGKAQPVKIYELISEELGGKTADPKLAEVLKYFNEGYEHYHAARWQAALDSFSKALDVNPQDEVSKLYVERCQEYLTEPPADDWDGVFVMKTK